MARDILALKSESAATVAGMPDLADPTDICAALERIRRSRAVGPSKRLIEFLTFVVETALHGEAEQLKETTIGVSLFGRPPDYDPKADPVVRNQAWRLRLKLTQYYSSEGAGDPWMILVPKGGYAPMFVRRREDNSGDVTDEARR